MTADTLDRVIDAQDTSRTARARSELPERAREAFLSTYPFEAFWEDLRLREADVVPVGAAPPAARPNGLIARVAGLLGTPQFAGAVSLCTLCLVVVFGFRLGTAEQNQGTGIRFKGGTDNVARSSAEALAPTAFDPVGVRFHVRDESGALPGRPGGAYREGDQFGFTYWSGNNDYLLLFSIEDSGKISVYYPDEAEESHSGMSVSIPRGRNVPLEGSVVLNDYVGYERFVVLFSHDPLPVDYVRRVARNSLHEIAAEGGDVRDLERLPVAAQQATFWIEKR